MQSWYEGERKRKGVRRRRRRNRSSYHAHFYPLYVCIFVYMESILWIHKVHALNAGHAQQCANIYNCLSLGLKGSGAMWKPAGSLLCSARTICTRISADIWRANSSCFFFFFLFSSLPLLPLLVVRRVLLFLRWMCLFSLVWWSSSSSSCRFFSCICVCVRVEFISHPFSLCFFWTFVSFLQSHTHCGTRVRTCLLFHFYFLLGLKLPFFYHLLSFSPSLSKSFYFQFIHTLTPTHTRSTRKHHCFFCLTHTRVCPTNHLLIIQRSIR